MSKTVIKISLPYRSIEKMLVLSEEILERHDALGEESPLKEIDMEKFRQRTKQARKHYEKGKALHAEAEAEIQRAYTKVGIYKGQNSRTPDTNYRDLTLIRMRLLWHFSDIPEGMSVFGFNVVIKQVMTGPKKKKKEE